MLKLSCPRCAEPIEVGYNGGGDKTLNSPSDIWRACQDMTALDHEEFRAILVNIKNQVLKVVTVSTGTLSAALVHPRDAFKDAVTLPAASVFFVHNHPSGDPEPSDEDAALTRRLVSAGDVLGIRVLDHVVIGETSWYSFADAGRLR